MVAYSQFSSVQLVQVAIVVLIASYTINFLWKLYHARRMVKGLVSAMNDCCETNIANTSDSPNRLIVSFWVTFLPWQVSLPNIPQTHTHMRLCPIFKKNTNFHQSITSTPGPLATLSASLWTQMLQCKSLFKPLYRSMRP